MGDFKHKCTQMSRKLLMVGEYQTRNDKKRDGRMSPIGPIWLIGPIRLIGGEWVGAGLIEDVIEEVVERFHRL